MLCPTAVPISGSRSVCAWTLCRLTPNDVKQEMWQRPHPRCIGVHWYRSDRLSRGSRPRWPPPGWTPPGWTPSDRADAHAWGPPASWASSRWTAGRCRGWCSCLDWPAASGWWRLQLETTTEDRVRTTIHYSVFHSVTFEPFYREDPFRTFEVYPYFHSKEWGTTIYTSCFALCSIQVRVHITPSAE